jgi:hypothetical protein
LWKWALNAAASKASRPPQILPANFITIQLDLSNNQVIKQQNKKMFVSGPGSYVQPSEGDEPVQQPDPIHRSGELVLDRWVPDDQPPMKLAPWGTITVFIHLSNLK